MAWSIPAEKHESLKARYHTCTCLPGTDRNYEWRRMQVVDVDFEQPEIASDERRIWYTVGCYDCRRDVLDWMPFGVNETGYALLTAAKGEATEYIIDVNGRHLAADHELALRANTAEAVRNIWDRCKSQGVRGKGCQAKLLIHGSELKLIYSCIYLVIADFKLLQRGGNTPEVALAGVMGDTGLVTLQKLADEMNARSCNDGPTTKPRTIYGATYHDVSLPQYLAEPVSRCIAYATGYPDRLARYLYATFGDAVAHGQTEADFVSAFVASHKRDVPFYRMVMGNLAHYYQNGM